ncbi:hypothetical protein HFN02_32910 [Rhizobium leguminosarum]|nr:hypothetical protein [Rhizobium leguminosarum]
MWTARDEEVAEIYRTNYADKLRFDELPVAVDFVVFDAGVNSGVGRGAKWLQSALGGTSDGVVGTKTIAAASAADPIKVITSVCANRLSFVRSLETLFKTFGKGWTSRIAFTEANGVSMSMKAAGSTTPQVTALPRPNPPRPKSRPRHSPERQAAREPELAPQPPSSTGCT